MSKYEFGVSLAQQGRGYTMKERTKRLSGQYKNLSGKLNHMAMLSNYGRAISRNAPCPCRSGKKYKKCCISFHGTNVKWIDGLQVAMSKLQSKLRKYGLQIARTR